MNLRKYSTIALAVIILAMAATPVGAMKWSWLNPYPQGNGLKHAAFLDNNTGFAVGENGAVIYTVTGGSGQFAWTVLDPITGQGLEGVSAPVTGFACAVGATGSILVSTNGGDTWQPKVSGVTANLHSVCFPIDNLLGYTCGDAGTILKTINSGDSWTTQTSHVTQNLNALTFANANSGIAVGAQGEVTWTNDGGSNWHAGSVPGTLIDLHDVAMLDANNGYACGDVGRVFRTSNGGQFWTQESLGLTPPPALRGVCFPTNISTGWVCGAMGTIAKTTDGGATWTIQIGGDPRNRTTFNSITFPTDVQTGFAFGDGGVIFKTTDGGASWDTLSRGFSGTTFGLAWPSRDTGYIAGLGVVYRTTNRGVDWQTDSFGLRFPASAIAFPTSSTGFVATMQGKIVRTTDAGGTWAKESIVGLRQDYTAIGFPQGVTTGFAMTSRGHIVKTINGGDAWTEVASPDTGNAYGTLFFRDDNVGFMTSMTPLIYRTADGGSNWTTINITTGGIRDFSFPGGGNKGYACGDNGQILVTADGGATWQSETSHVTASLMDIAFPVGDSLGFAVGDGSTIIFTRDGGQHWNPQTVPARQHRFFDIAFPNLDSVAYVAGDQSVVLKADSPGVAVAERRTEPGRDVSRIGVFPNPAHGLATVYYSLPRAGRASVKLFDVVGAAVRVISSGYAGAGEYQLRVNTTGLARGVYILGLQTQGWTATRKLVLE